MRVVFGFCRHYVLHVCLVLRWSAIATHLSKRTDNEIKNYWNTHLKKRLAKMGIDPVTHKPKNDALLSSDGQSKSAANLSHMAQWESARLEAEARLVRESKLRSHSYQHQLGSTVPMPARSLDVPNGWPGVWSKSTEGNGTGVPAATGIGSDLESPTSTLTYSENAPPIMAAGVGDNSVPMIEFVGSTSGSSEAGIVKEEGEQDWKRFKNSTHLPEYKEGMENSVSFTSSLHDISVSVEGTWTPESLRTGGGHVHFGNIMGEEGFTNLLLNNSDDQSLSDAGDDSDNGGASGSGGSHDYYEDNKNYWSSILNLVNSPPSDSPLF